MESGGRFERVLLVGFMGSGKTRVGRLLSKRLGWAFVDFDEEISKRTGLPIPAIFSEHGEGFFRQVEDQVGLDFLRASRVVLASGGGWPVRPGRMEGLARGTFSVWLKVTAEEALRRAAAEGPIRPLLQVSDPLERARCLLAEREPFYRKAQAAIDSSTGGPDELAERIVKMMYEMGLGLSGPLPPHK